MFKYLQTDNRTVVFALSTDIRELLRVRKNVLKPASLGGLPIHIDTFSRNWPLSHTVCEDKCPVLVDMKVTVEFSGPVTSKAEKLAKLEALITQIKSSDGESILDGFPANPNSTFVTAAK